MRVFVNVTVTCVPMLRCRKKIGAKYNFPIVFIYDCVDGPSLYFIDRFNTYKMFRATSCSDLPLNCAGQL
jgi:hypothetical protein